MMRLQCAMGLTEKQALDYVQKVVGNVRDKSFSYNPGTGLADYECLNPKERSKKHGETETETETT